MMEGEGHWFDGCRLRLDAALCTVEDWRGQRENLSPEPWCAVGVFGQ